MAEVTNDPDRILAPAEAGRRARASSSRSAGTRRWPTSPQRLSTLRDTYGPKSIAVHEGNPPYFSYSAVFWGKGFQDAIGTPWFYGVNSEDGASSVAATKILFGACGDAADPGLPPHRRADDHRREPLGVEGQLPPRPPHARAHEGRRRPGRPGVRRRSPPDGDRRAVRARRDRGGHRRVVPALRAPRALRRRPRRRGVPAGRTPPASTTCGARR